MLLVVRTPKKVRAEGIDQVKARECNTKSIARTRDGRSDCCPGTGKRAIGLPQPRRPRSQSFPRLSRRFVRGNN